MGLLDRRLGLGVLATTLGTAGVLTAGVVTAARRLAAGRRIADRPESRPTESDDPIDVASDDSFPASDPPSSTGTIAEVAEEA
jgi:hypothetical protein